MGLLTYIAALSWGSGQWNSFSTLLHYLGQWAVELLSYIAAL